MIKTNSSVEFLYSKFLQCSHISTDTRHSSLSNSLFFALHGPNHNGNTFIPTALSKGCKYAVSDTPASLQPLQFQYEPDPRIIYVPNTLLALHSLALHHRKQFISLPIIGITGSNGKTTTKQLTALLLSAKYNILATEGSLNNQFGTPLTILKLKKQHQIAVIEMGISKKGDMNELLGIVQPTCGVITNVMKAHINGFGSRQGIMKEKGKLYEWIREKKGKVWVNEGDEMLMGESEGIQRVLYGVDGKEDVTGRVTNTPSQLFLRFQWQHKDIHQQIQTQLVGTYNLSNLLTAISIALSFSVPPSSIPLLLSSYTPSNNRSQYKITLKNHLVIDCFNANPSSMQLSLLNFDKLKLVLGKKFWIVGMMELGGKIQVEENRRVVEWFRQKEWREGERVVFVGRVFQKIEKGEENEERQIRYFESVDELIEMVKKEEIKGYQVFIKGSASVKLSKVIPFL